MRAQSTPTRFGLPRGFTLLELLVVVTILGLIVGLAAGTAGSVAMTQQYRSATQAVEHAFLRARMLAENGGGAILRQEGNVLIAEAEKRELPPVRVTLPRDWRLERGDYFHDFAGLAEFGADGSAYNAIYLLVSPEGDETEIEYLGITGQMIVEPREDF
jgi:prepilin-type N-terminal cleavage/methylation domain-containing protein